MVFTTLWQEVYHWTVISSAVHMLPIGVMAFVASFTILVTIATLLLAFADRPGRYWTFVFPGFVIGSTGAMLCYTHTNIAIFHTMPPSMAGTVGAIFNGALQLGSAIGLAAVTSIETSVEEVPAVFWFLLSIFAVQTVGVLAFHRNRSTTTGSGSNGAGDRDEKFTVILDLRNVLRNTELDSVMLDR
ncbi:hypothetical protein PILCRDRAFT_828966 [Piloderma croceum F 1598]|uniref:Major facilitator superfamily (MFS) profile domain-containing protein n=1 Tax=Piloderma croceum (strain F 1598) TaxID=765440 RepID=A0A0C3F0V7_PILCF|nr:hypothetical protein PILCRDRAFT_828966 [Piloderma croceum F 1598]